MAFLQLFADTPTGRARELRRHGVSKLIKIGAKVVRHSRQIIFQMAEVAVPRELFRAILEGIGRLRLATMLSG
jgi:hypothetical protein